MAILYMIPTTFALPTSPPPDNGQSNDSPFEKYKDGIIAKFWALAASLCDNIVSLFIIVMGILHIMDLLQARLRRKVEYGYDCRHWRYHSLSTRHED